MVMAREAVCEFCDGPMPVRIGRRFCSSACAKADRADELRTGDVIRSLLGVDRERAEREPATLVYDEAGQLIAKRCACGNHFPIEYQDRGPMTTRALCDDCRSSRHGERTYSKPPVDVARCKSCVCVIGPEYGGAEPGVDGLCRPCAGWREKATERERVLAAGFVNRDIGWVRRAPTPVAKSGVVAGESVGKALEKPVDTPKTADAPRIAPECAKCDPPSSGELLTVREAATLFGVVPRTVHIWIGKGKIRARDDGMVLMIPRAEVERVRAAGAVA